MNETIVNLRVFRFLRALLNIGFWLSIGGGILYLALLLVSPANATSSLIFDGFFLTGDAVTKGGSLYMLYVFSSALVLCTGVACIWLLRAAVNSLQEGSPFTKKNVGRIRLIGCALLLQAYLKQVLFYLFAKNLADAASINGLSSAIQPRVNLIPEGAVLALCILVLAEIFRFGCTLQHEHDTTV